MRLLFLLIILPTVALAQSVSEPVSEDYYMNYDCVRAVDQCWKTEDPFLCSGNKLQNFDYYGEIMGFFCSKVINLGNSYKYVVSILDQAALALEDSSRTINRLVRRNKRLKTINRKLRARQR